MDPGVELGRLLFRKVHLQYSFICTSCEKWEIPFLNCYLLLRRRNWQACFVWRTIMFHVCSDFSSTACIKVILWCVALGWHHHITFIKSCAFLRPLLWLSCVKGFLCFVFVFFSFRVCSFHLSAWIEICQTWCICGVKYLTSTVHWVLFACLCFCMCFGALLFPLPPTILFFLDILLWDIFL